jgi:hypothetical protein
LPIALSFIYAISVEKPHDEGVFAGIGVIVLPDPPRGETNLAVEVKSGLIAPSDLQQIHYPPPLIRKIQCEEEQGVGNSLFAEVGMGGQIQDMDLFHKYPKDDIAQNPIAPRVVHGSRHKMKGKRSGNFVQKHLSVPRCNE